jgi:tryptophanyl-tRNA synthetase
MSPSELPSRARVLTGDRPTGALHLGHYFGTLANRVRLQANGHELFVVIADYQVIADRDHPGDLAVTVLELVRDYAAVGIDPERATIFTHSAIPALNQLLLPFLSLVTVSELHRNPTVKQEAQASKRSSLSGLMLTYPVHQAADVLFCGAELVPVGSDQLPHLELTRQIARRFNDRYAPVFSIPSALVGETPVLLGLDGRKMGKSAGNAIALSACTDDVAKLVRAAKTDAERAITFEPDRRPEVARLLSIASLCSGCPPVDLAAQIGSAGAAALKDCVVDAIEGFLRPFRERRESVTRADAGEILRRGNVAADAIANETLAQVRAAMGMTTGLAERSGSVRASMNV